MNNLEYFIGKYQNLVKLDVPHDVEYEYRQLLNLLLELHEIRNRFKLEIKKTDDMLFILDDPNDKVAVEFAQNILKDMVTIVHLDEE